MIKARLEAKNLRIWLTCIAVFLCGIIICTPFLGILDDDMLYSVFPFLNFRLVISGEGLPAWLVDNFSFGVSIACICAAVALVFHVVYVIVLNVYRAQRRKAARILKKTGYSKDYYDVLEDKRRKLKRSVFSSTNDLCLAKEYCDGRRYESAFEILRNINIDDFDLKDAARYYALYAYVFTITGDLKNARFALELDEPFVEKLKGSDEADFARALLAYAEHNFDEAKSGFKALLKCRNNEIRVWAGLYLGLLYLRMHSKEKARKLAVSLSGCKKSPRQSEDLLKLLKKIETAYALEAEEEAEKTRAEFVVPAGAGSDSLR